MQSLLHRSFHICADGPFDLDAVDAFELRAHQRRGDARAVGQQQQPFGGVVEPADGNEMFEFFVEGVVDDFASARVVFGHELAAGFVVDDDGHLFVGRNPFAADVDLVALFVHLGCGIGDDFAVDADVAVENGAVGFAPRIGGVVGNEFVQAHHAIPFSTRSCRCSTPFVLPASSVTTSSWILASSISTRASAASICTASMVRGECVA